MNIDKLKSNLSSKSEEELNEILDQRDKQEFDAAWCQVYEVVDEVEVEIEEEELFKELSSSVLQHEIASYIIDDFIILKKADEMGISPPFVIYMKECYEKGLVPNVWAS